MAAGRYTFIIEQGATFQIELKYRDSTGSPISLADYGARMQIRQTKESETALLSLSSSLQGDGTGLNMSGSNGTTLVQSGSLGVYISAASSSLLNFGEAVYDLEIHSGSYVARLLEGKVKLSKEVTR
mgnify:CR=1 FL=1